MKLRLTIEELEELDPLGWLAQCNNCGKPTYRGTTLDNKFPNGVNLPDGFSISNRRKYVTVGKNRILVCTKCRCDVFGAY
jgi:hypothetical protein